VKGERLVFSFSLTTNRSPLTTKKTMLDLIFIAVTIGFFLLALGYLTGCESLKKGVNGK